jgi:hypothetical protein
MSYIKVCYPFCRCMILLLRVEMAWVAPSSEGVHAIPHVQISKKPKTKMLSPRHPFCLYDQVDRFSIGRVSCTSATHAITVTTPLEIDGQHDPTQAHGNA